MFASWVRKRRCPTAIERPTTSARRRISVFQKSLGTYGADRPLTPELVVTEFLRTGEAAWARHSGRRFKVRA
jgi:hypothetical protein